MFKGGCFSLSRPDVGVLWEDCAGNVIFQIIPLSYRQHLSPVDALQVLRGPRPLSSESLSFHISK
jgi:hypothetical protein